MPWRPRFLPLRYGVAVLSVGVALLLKWFLYPLTDPEAPFLLFFAAVMISAWYGGQWQGLAATLLSAVVVPLLFLPAEHDPSVGSVVQILIFILEGALISWLTGSLRRARWLAEDLTRERQAALTREQTAHGATRSAEQRYRDLVNSVDAVVWEAEPETLRFSFVSNRAESLLGYPVADWLASPDFWPRLIHPDDREQTLARCREAAAQGRSQDLEYRVRTADGQVVWLRDLMDVQQATNGHPARLRGLMVDVTERKRVENALRESEARFRQLADAMPQIVWTARPDGYVDYFNRRWYEYTGFLEGQGGDDSWTPILHPDDVQPCLDTWYAAVRAGLPYQIEYRFKDHRNGSYRWHLGRAVPARDSDGRITRWFGICTDIDDQKRTQDALREADRRKDEFLTMLSHELRNPLAAVRNGVHILQLGRLSDPSLVEARDVIDRQSQQLTEMVNELLDVFRLTQKRTVLNRDSLDLTRLLDLTVRDHRPAVAKAQLTLHLDLPNEPVWVLGDSTRLTQVLGNLLQNAIKFTNGGGEVWVCLKTEPRTSRAWVTIRDSGIGISAEVLPHVFETFAQEDRSLDRSRGGLGLGLALVKSVVEQHGGQAMAASSGPGNGAEFSFWLPLNGKRRAVPRRPPEVASSPGLRVLIVEDSQDTARTLAMLLRHYGHEVAMAHSGRQGVRLARELLPDVVLCDLGLPEMDGYEVASALRSDPATAAVRLIAVSGYGQDDDIRRSAENGFDLHLTKPVDPLDLQHHLAELKVGADDHAPPLSSSSIPAH